MSDIEASLLVEVVSIGLMDDGFHGVEVMDADENSFTITMEPEEVQLIGKAGLLGKKVRITILFPLTEAK